MTAIDRTGWPPGPWDDEDDRYEWRDETTGLPCLAKRNHLGVLCGYVAVAPGHRWHGVAYDAVPVDVHGGLTYADGCDVEAGICHTPAPGEPGDVWWLGFDCAHIFDLVPSMLAHEAAMPESLFERCSYKTIGYVTAQCAHLASQIQKADGDKP